MTGDVDAREVDPIAFALRQQDMAAMAHDSLFPTPRTRDFASQCQCDIGVRAQRQSFVESYQCSTAIASRKPY
jgi:hypothetical protein